MTSLNKKQEWLVKNLMRLCADQGKKSSSGQEFTWAELYDGGYLDGADQYAIRRSGNIRQEHHRHDTGTHTKPSIQKLVELGILKKAKNPANSKENIYTITCELSEILPDYTPPVVSPTKDFPTLEQIDDLIENARYMILSTIALPIWGQPQIPHTTPVFFARSGDTLRFYWLSAGEAKHSMNIAENPHVSGVITDTNFLQGTGVGFYFNGKARVVKEGFYGYPRCEDNVAITELCKKAAKDNGGTLASPDAYLKPDSPRKIYCVDIDKAWCNGAMMHENGMWVDATHDIPVHNPRGMPVFARK